MIFPARTAASILLRWLKRRSYFFSYILETSARNSSQLVAVVGFQ
jgi:hypothetical protein